MNTQEIFDKAVMGVINQGGPSIFMRKCLYRGPDGKKCAAGHLIPDDLYDLGLEGTAFRYVEDRLNLLKTWEDVKLVERLQMLHDECAIQDNFVQRFKSGAADIAKEYGLTIP